MTLTCQNVIDRGKQYNPLNVSLATDPTELVTRLQQMQQRVFTAVASLPATIVGRSKFSQSQVLVSSSAASARVVSLNDASRPVERVVQVELASGAIVHPVLDMDLYAQRSPRYVLRGTTLVEVGTDWSAVSGVVSLTVRYAYGAPHITPTGGTGQVLSIPDEWADLLIKPLAMYFHTKDPGRDPSEYATIEAEYTATWNGFLAYITNYGGVFDLTNLGMPLPSAPEARRGAAATASGGAS